MPRNPLAILACSAVLVGTPVLVSNAVGQALKANPSTLTGGSHWEVGADTVRPRYRLNLGPERYVLYFDANRRLVATITSRPPLPVRRAERHSAAAATLAQR